MSFDGNNAEGADASAETSAGSTNTAGFFGRGGGNRGRNRKSESGGDVSGEADERDCDGGDERGDEGEARSLVETKTSYLEGKEKKRPEARM